MVLVTNYVNLKKGTGFLKYFFYLGKKKFWSGGGSFGKKVFGGQVGCVSGGRFFFKIIGNYSIININGFVQAFKKPFGNNFIINLIFFKKYGLFSFLPAEETTTLSTIISINIFENETLNGNANLINNFLTGSVLFCLQTKGLCNATVARSSGTFCKILKKINNGTFIQFPSKVVGIIPINNFVTKGVSKKISFKQLKKAGDTGLLGGIPKVGGIAMNPVDHPHGGRTNGGCHPKTPTGFLTKNVKTGKKKNWSNSTIFSLRK